jgi:hypothetical protein
MRADTKSWSEINPPFLCSPWSRYCTESAFRFSLASLPAAKTRVYYSGGSNSGVEIKLKLVPVRAMKAYRGSRAAVPHILKFGAK